MDIEKESWAKEFDEEYGDLPIEQWCVGFVATVMLEDSLRPKYGKGSSRSFLTKKLKEKFDTLLERHEKSLRESIHQKLLNIEHCTKTIKAALYDEARTQIEVEHILEQLKLTKDFLTLQPTLKDNPENK